MSFDPVKVKDEIIEWIRDWFEKNGPDCKAVVGISGGKDSAVVAGLCAKALGSDRVFGVLMPHGRQADIQDGIDACEYFEIDYTITNIRFIMRSFVSEVNYSMTLSEQALTNLPARIRMTVLYCMSQCMNGRVANTSNLSEDYIGYTTKYGDSAGDFAPIKSLTSEEVIEIGRTLGIPEHLLTKPPADGITGKTDEDNLGFDYAVLDKYIRTGEIDNPDVKEKIDRLHDLNLFKIKPMEQYNYTGD